MLVRREIPADVAQVRRVHAAAFARPQEPESAPAEVRLVDELRAGGQWLPRLSWVAEDETGQVVGHVVCSRGWLDDASALGLGPLGVLPEVQRHGVGSALMHAVIGAADALDEPLIVLLGDPAYYRRFGFRSAAELGIEPPLEQWRSYFQALPLHAYRPHLRGTFRYAEPFQSV